MSVYPGLVAYYSGVFHVSPLSISLYGEGLTPAPLLLSSFVLLASTNNLDISIRIYLNHAIKG